MLTIFFIASFSVSVQKFVPVLAPDSRGTVRFFLHFVSDFDVNFVNIPFQFIRTSFLLTQFVAKLQHP